MFLVLSYKILAIINKCNKLEINICMYEYKFTGTQISKNNYVQGGLNVILQWKVVRWE